jgi:hypothetical protein
VPYEFTVSAADCADLLRQTGWNPAPTVTYVSALAHLHADPALDAATIHGLRDALSAASSACDALNDAVAPYFIPACT